MDDIIATTAEAVEDAAMPCPPPRLHEVHTDPDRRCHGELPAVLQEPSDSKSAARWAFERLILYIRNFEAGLDNHHEVAMGFTGGETGVIRIEGMGYFDPDIITFYGSDPDGAKTQLIQHVTQLNVMLRALPKDAENEAPNRIGFRLGAEIGEAATEVKQDAPQTA